MKTVLGLLVNTAIAFLLLILITFVSRGSICFLTVNPTPPIATPSLFLGRGGKQNTLADIPGIYFWVFRLVDESVFLDANNL